MTHPARTLDPLKAQLACQNPQVDVHLLPLSYLTSRLTALDHLPALVLHEAFAGRT